MNSDQRSSLARQKFAHPYFIYFIDIQFRRNQTKTIKGEALDDASRDFLAHNALKYKQFEMCWWNFLAHEKLKQFSKCFVYESDFYWFCRYLFNERMRALQIEPSPNTNTWVLTNEDHLNNNRRSRLIQTLITRLFRLYIHIFSFCLCVCHNYYIFQIILLSIALLLLVSSTQTI